MLRCSFLSVGFRPFFLFGTGYSILLMTIWMGYQLSGWLPVDIFQPTVWHAHEMIYGFVVAIVAGFLLTASAHWTQSMPISGGGLLALLAIWCLGRISFVLGEWIGLRAVGLLDVAFLISLFLCLAPRLWASQKPRLMIFLVVVALLFSGNAMVHWGNYSESDELIRSGLLLGVDTLTLLMVLIGGRIIPLFTGNAISTVNIRRYLPVEILAVGGTALYLVLDLFMGEGMWAGVAAMVAGVANLIRLVGWGGNQTLKRPILWVLHLGYLFVATGLLLRGMSLSLGIVRYALSLHLLMAGAMGTLILGMVSRVALGHTGRTLQVSALTTVAYLLVAASALVRVFVPWLVPDWNLPAIVVAGVLWGLAYTIYFVEFAPILVSPRADS